MKVISFLHKVLALEQCEFYPPSKPHLADKAFISLYFSGLNQSRIY